MSSEEIIKYVNERIEWLESLKVSDDEEKLKQARISELKELLWTYEMRTEE